VNYWELETMSWVKADKNGMKISLKTGTAF
jgi:hypothetical protein